MAVAPRRSKADGVGGVRTQRRPAPLGTRNFDSIERFARIELNGEFEPSHQFLLDNRSHAGRPGYEVLTPFRTE